MDRKASPELTLHQLRVFNAVVQTGSLTGAALALDLPQPSVSRLIARIENTVGVALLERLSTGVTMTAAGEHFHQNAVRAVAFHDLAVEEARPKIKQPPNRSLRRSSQTTVLSTVCPGPG